MAIEEYDAALPFPPDRPSSLPTDRCTSSTIDHEEVSRMFRGCFVSSNVGVLGHPRSQLRCPFGGCQERQEAALTTLPCMPQGTCAGEAPARWLLAPHQGSSIWRWSNSSASRRGSGLRDYAQVA